MSDAELLEALAHLEVDPAHLRALYQRIERPFRASMLCAAVSFRLRRGQGDEVDVETAWPLTSVTVNMSYDNDQQVPRYLKPSLWLTKGEVLPNSRHGELYWIALMLGWLVRHLVQTQGGIEILRAEVARHTTEDPPLLRVPSYSFEEAQWLVQFVDGLESPHYPYDRPLLLWVDTDDYLCCSRKPPQVGSPRRSEVDIDGQNWSRLGRLPQEPA
jgi:hypothetical protein